MYIKKAGDRQCKSGTGNAHINKLSAECVAREDELHDLQRSRGTQQHTLANSMEALAEARTQARDATAAHRELYGEAPPVAI